MNSVVFASGGGSTTTWWTGNGGASTGDPGLDQILNTHNNTGGTNPLTITLTGLTPFHDYQFQFIVGHDARGCCSGRSYSIGDGAGGDSGFDLVRNAGGNGATGSLAGTMVGTFTADAATQSIQIGGFAGDGVDAAVSGYALRKTAVPEPSGALLLGLSGMAFLFRRRK